MIDIGANLTDTRFANDLPEVLVRARAAGVSHIVVTGTNLANSAAAVALCAAWPAYLSATCGIHPHDAARAPAQWPTRLHELALSRHVRAIGETGLDFNRNISPRHVQEQVFAQQLEIAAAMALPLFVHDRDSDGRVAAMLADCRTELCDVVVHCFTGDGAALEALLALDCYIGITGWVCDERRGGELAKLVPRIPSNRLLIETDAPFLTPRSLPQRPRPQRNEPAFLPHIAATVAMLRGEPTSALIAITHANARRLFRLQTDAMGSDRLSQPT